MSDTIRMHAAMAAAEQKISSEQKKLLNEREQIFQDLNSVDSKSVSPVDVIIRENFPAVRENLIGQLGSLCIKLYEVGLQNKEILSCHHQVENTLQRVKNYDAKAYEDLLSVYIGDKDFSNLVAKSRFVHSGLLDIVSDVAQFSQNPGLFAKISELYFTNVKPVKDFAHLESKLSDFSELMTSLKESRIARAPQVSSFVTNTVNKMFQEYLDVTAEKVKEEKTRVELERSPDHLHISAEQPKPSKYVAALEAAFLAERKQGHNCENVLLENLKTAFGLSEDPAVKRQLERQFNQIAGSRGEKLINEIVENIFKIFKIEINDYLNPKPGYNIHDHLSRPAQSLLKELLGKELTLKDVSDIVSRFNFSSVTSRFPDQNEAVKSMLTSCQERITLASRAFPFISIEGQPIFYQIPVGAAGAASVGLSARSAAGAAAAGVELVTMSHDEKTEQFDLKAHAVDLSVSLPPSAEVAKRPGQQR